MGMGNHIIVINKQIYYTSTSTLPAMGASPLFGVAVDASTQSSKIKDGTYVNSLEYNGKESVSRFGFEME